MTTTVEPLDVDEDSDHVARCRVRTEDATGTERVYRCSIGVTTLHGQYLIGMRQVEGPEAPRPHKTPRITAAAREYFREQGYEVYGDE